MPTRVGDDAEPRVAPSMLAAGGRAQPGDVERRGRRSGPRSAGIVVARLGLSRGPTASTWRQLRRRARRRVHVAPATARAAIPSSRARTAGWTAVIAGLRYVKGKRVLQSTFTVDIVAMVFGMPRVLFPALAGDAVPPRRRSAVGLAVRARRRSARSSARSRRAGSAGSAASGLAIIVAVVVWGAAITAFGLVGDRPRGSRSRSSRSRAAPM